MIKEKQLVPGRMLQNLQKVTYRDADGHLSYKKVWVPCMVVSYLPSIDRRHSKNEARRSGWEVLVFWFDDRRERLARVFIYNDAFTLNEWSHCGW